ncbi:MAG: SdpA family antimicrobial peptide system protein [Leucobacter sp.]
MIRTKRRSTLLAEWLFLVTLLALIGLVAVSHVKDVAIVLPVKLRALVTTVAPQGWAFFTKSPRGDEPVIWVEDQGHWRVSAHQRGAAISNFGGLSRTARSDAARVELMLEEVQGSDKGGSQCEPEHRISACLKNASTTEIDRSDDSMWDLCGRVGVALQKPVPWTWARKDTEARLGSTVYKFNISCAQ